MTFEEALATPGRVVVNLRYNDPGGRFKAGEHGVLLFNDYDKYNYKVLLPGILPAVPGACGPSPRVFYFYEHEVERWGT